MAYHTRKQQIHTRRPGQTGQAARTSKKPLPLWKALLLDVLAIGVFLCVFSYFHHVNPIGADQDPVALPTQTAGAAGPSSSAAQSPGAVFLSEGEAPQKTDTTYLSQNVNVTVSTAKKGDVVYHVAEIYVRDVTYLKTALAGGSYEDAWSGRMFVDDLARSVNAFVAINGDQCKAHKTGVVVRDGVLYRDSVYRDVCVLHYDGTLSTIPQKQFQVDSLKQTGAWQAWSFGPMLLQNGQPMTQFNTDVANANPRSAIGMIEPNHFILLSVDGRGDSPGMTMEELSQLVYELGCTVAYNLDGGDTSAMAVNGEIYSNPSGDRKATDIIYIGLE